VENGGYGGRSPPNEDYIIRQSVCDQITYYQFVTTFCRRPEEINSAETNRRDQREADEMQRHSRRDAKEYMPKLAESSAISKNMRDYIL
jgi:hypothetical protein